MGRKHVLIFFTELKCSGTSCGFSAQRFFSPREPAENKRRKYKIKYSTVGNSFDEDSGIFTAPVDGLYVASISLCLSGNENVQVSVQHQQGLDIVCSCVCWCSAEMKHTSACGLGVVDMKAGDKLSTTVNPESSNNSWVNFACFLLR